MISIKMTVNDIKHWNCRSTLKWFSNGHFLVLRSHLEFTNAALKRISEFPIYNEHNIDIFNNLINRVKADRCESKEFLFKNSHVGMNLSRFFCFEKNRNTYFNRSYIKKFGTRKLHGMKNHCPFYSLNENGTVWLIIMPMDPAQSAHWFDNAKQKDLSTHL